MSHHCLIPKREQSNLTEVSGRSLYFGNWLILRLAAQRGYPEPPNRLHRYGVSFPVARYFCDGIPNASATRLKNANMAVTYTASAI
jgi:hypothetical protein